MPIGGRRRRDHRGVWAASVVIAVLAASGCAPGDAASTPPADTPAAALATTAPPVVPARFAQQDVDWLDCGDGLVCATVLAPLDWAHPEDGRTVELALARRPADGERIGTLFMNPGGPGASGYEAVHERWATNFSPALAERFDLVGWDPRGVGRSSRVVCYTEPEERHRWLFDTPGPDWRLDRDGWLAAQLAKGADYVDACEDGSGELLGYIDTVSTVHDLDLLRGLLGDERLHFMGYSYGTSIAQHYLDRYPDRVGRMVLDGVVDPAVSPLEHDVQQEGGFQAALVRFVEECAPRFGDACPIPAGADAGLSAIRALHLRFDAEPTPATDPTEERLLNGEIVRTAIIEALYSDDEWAKLRKLLRELSASPPVTDTAFVLADRYHGLDPDAGPEDFAADAESDSRQAINCMDGQGVRGPEQVEEFGRELARVAPTLASPAPTLPDIVCSNWPYPPRLAPTAEIRGEGLPPILVVSTTGDPATPHAWGVAVAERLVSATLITNHAAGHTAYVATGEAGACVRGAVDAYLIDGVVPQADPHCGR